MSSTAFPGLRRAFWINFASVSAGRLLGFALTLVLARLITPAQMGVFALAAVVVNVSHVLRDFGVSSWLQREAELTPDKIRAAWGLLCCSAWSLGLALFLASGPLSRLYAQPELRSVVRVLAFAFLPVPFNALMSALMHRQLAARQIAYVSRLGGGAYAIVAIVLAAQHFGALSLAWAQLANGWVCGLAYWPLRPMGMRWWPRAGHWSGMLNFGLGSLALNVLGAVNAALPDAILGKLASVQQVGWFGRANSAVHLFGNMVGGAINFGAISTLAETHHRGQSLLPQLARSTALLTGVGWPALLFCSLFGHEIILALFGVAWLDAVPAIPALAWMAALQLLFNFSAPALMAIGRPALAAAPLALTLLARVGLLLALFHGGIAQFSWLLLGAALIALPLQLWLQAHQLGQSLLHQLAAARPSLVVTVAVAAALLALRAVLPVTFAAPLQLTLALPIALFAWLAALRMSAHPLGAELQRLRRTMRK